MQLSLLFLSPFAGYNHDLSWLYLGLSCLDASSQYNVISWLWTRLILPVIGSGTCTRHQTCDPHVAKVLLLSSGSVYMWSAKPWLLSLFFLTPPFRAPVWGEKSIPRLSRIPCILIANVLEWHSSMLSHVDGWWSTKGCAGRLEPCCHSQLVPCPAKENQSGPFGVSDCSLALGVAWGQVGGRNKQCSAIEGALD